MASRVLFQTAATVVVVVTALAFFVTYGEFFQSDRPSHSTYKVPPNAAAVPASSSEAENPPVRLQAASRVEAEQFVAPEKSPQSSDAAEVPAPTTVLPEDAASGGSLPDMEVSALAGPPATAPPVQPPPAHHPPQSLGQLAVKPGDTLFKMVGTVYGRATNRYMRAVIEANPQIKNPNTIDLGDVVTFPALAYPRKATKENGHWIILEEHDNLDETLQRLYLLQDIHRTGLRIIACWTPAAGLKFWIAAQPCFEKERDAVSYLEALPSGLTAQARLQSGWPEDGRLYAYPY